ncbi:hypothetical protein A9Z42_0012910 [Trichoderma parareesei]|uniref:FAD-binding FR-type domain-containing protein n=1 Tax=Trichoderma parareesei TaxID=858221 RepID=A0A2H2ZLP6_TRIPA|nr:hypothetical protein A9Z42_0012910 [Trichoderma parareesei]
MAAAVSGLQGWHPGEIAMQTKLGYAGAMATSWRYIENAMREQHRIFHTSNLPFIPITTLDDEGRPWASIVAGADGEIGFVEGPDLKTLIANARLWPGEPLLDTLNQWVDRNGQNPTSPERYLTAGIGIEFPTRRRNKFAGYMEDVKRKTELDFRLKLKVNQTTGNCPKYINVRKLVGHAKTKPTIAYEKRHMAQLERLPQEVIDFITEADTVFIGSVYRSDPATAYKFPSHTGMNARGGLPGFTRVSPSDGRTVVLPDYSGNRFMSSLGNVEKSKQVALTIVSFTTGDVLYLTGTAEHLVGPDALAVMVKHASVTVMKTTGFIFVRDALPVRQQFGSEVERSPYSPKVKYLVEEPEGQANAIGSHKAKLTSATQLSHDLAVFRFSVTTKPGVDPIKIRPGQAVALDFMDWIGPPAYQHMANSAPGSVNDDRVRTWTVSSAHEDEDVTWFDITMRRMKGGAVTGALFDVLERHSLNKYERPIAITEDVVAEVVGVTGDFFLGPDDVNMLWVAGGIGITPFLSMFSALSDRRAKANGDVVLALSTREPDLMLRLIQSSLRNAASNVRIRIDLFTHQETIDTGGIDQRSIQIVLHKGRIGKDYWPQVASGRDVLICGPGAFGDVAMDGLRAAGVPEQNMLREGFY